MQGENFESAREEIGRDHAARTLGLARRMKLAPIVDPRSLNNDAGSW